LPAGRESSEPNTPEVCTSTTPPPLKAIGEFKSNDYDQGCGSSIERTAL